MALFLGRNFYASPANKIEQFTLENGMEVFLLENPSDALIHIEYTCRSGFSFQDKDNAGFFKLYTKLFSASLKNRLTDAQCNADSSRYFITATASQAQSVLTELSDTAFNPQFTDDLISLELSKLKSETSTAAEDMGTFINSAIDSRVFSAEPWKHDSGIYPELFKKTTEKQARTKIRYISDRFYTPQNSAVFIHGNINSEHFLLLLKNTFGRYNSSFKTPFTNSKKNNLDSHKKFVIHNPQISQDLIQVVVQYCTLQPEQGDIFAAAFNNNSSTFKNQTLELTDLNIPGDEYINVQSAHKKDNSRLIFQTLLQKPSDKKKEKSSQKTAQKFVDSVKAAAANLQDGEINLAKNVICAQTEEIAGTPSLLMENLSAWWALAPYSVPNSVSENAQNEMPELVKSFLLRKQRIYSTDCAQAKTFFNEEEPFVFIITNSKDYKKYKADYDKAGYSEITVKNASWYVNQLNKNIDEQFKPDETPFYNITKLKSDDNNYFDKNFPNIKTTRMNNGILLVTKKDEITDKISLLISIAGGKLNSAKDHGFEETMINILAMMIEQKISEKQKNGIILGNVNVTSASEISTSTILIECEKDDFVSVCSAAATAIVYGEVPPVAADRAVSSRRYKKRLENGSAVNQMISAAIKTIYGKGDIYNIFETEKDALKDTDYKKILQAYPQLLDAKRYSIVVCGNFSDHMIQKLTESFEILCATKTFSQPQIPEAKVPQDYSQKIKITHTFLTDIPAEEAGPQPAVLIPTTEFLDPVVYINPCPDDFSDKKSQALFNALNNHLCRLLNVEGYESQIILPRSKMNFLTIVIQNTMHTAKADEAYKKAVDRIYTELQKKDAANFIVQDIKNSWTQSQMQKTITNSGTAMLIQKGIELFPENPVPDFYLQEYSLIQEAGAQDFLELMYLLKGKAAFRLYSAESKK